MSEQWTATGTGAGTGAATGAIAGSTFGPVGTVVGAGVGAIAGGAAGYISSRGVAAKKRAIEEARARYAQAIQRYNALNQIAGNDFRNDTAALSNDNAASFQNSMANRPGDQTAALNHNLDQSAATLTPQGQVGSALQGPLGAQYAAEGAARTRTAIQPMALGNAIDTNQQAAINNDRNYAVSQAQLGARGNSLQQTFGLSQSEYAKALDAAALRYNQETGDAQQVGNRDILTGGLLQAGLNTGGQLAMGYGRMAPRKPLTARQQGQLELANSSNSQDSWNSRVPVYTGGSAYA